MGTRKPPPPGHTRKTTNDWAVLIAAFGITLIAIAFAAGIALYINATDDNRPWRADCPSGYILNPKTGFGSQTWCVFQGGSHMIEPTWTRVGK